MKARNYNLCSILIGIFLVPNVVYATHTDQGGESTSDYVWACASLFPWGYGQRISACNANSPSGIFTSATLTIPVSGNYRWEYDCTDPGSYSPTFYGYLPSSGSTAEFGDGQGYNILDWSFDDYIHASVSYTMNFPPYSGGNTSHTFHNISGPCY